MSREIIRLKRGQSAMFGYGSLLLPDSMELTLGKPYIRDLFLCSVNGWRRSWDIMMPNQNFYEQVAGEELYPENIVYLNLSQAEGQAVNGLIYILEPEELELFDKREWIYDRVSITDTIETHTVESGEAYAYVGKLEYRLPPGAPKKQAAIRNSYLEIIENGLQRLDQDFSRLYDESTDPVPFERVFKDQKRGSTNQLLADLKNKK